jgi:hypothetical protein
VIINFESGALKPLTSVAVIALALSVKLIEPASAVEKEEKETAIITKAITVQIIRFFILYTPTEFLLIVELSE